MTASTLFGVQFGDSTYAASDFKTLYASIWCFVHGLNAYSIPNLQAVFIANDVVQPERWYGHAPVYPWTTLALGSPFALMSMKAACYAVTVLSGVLLAIAIAALMRYAANRFDLGLGWRAAIAGLCAGSPLLAFAMAMGNVSVAASALCFVAFAWRSSLRSRGGRSWAPSIALAVAFLLKPHLALWAGLAMALLPERSGRIVAARALGIIAAFSAAVAVVMAMTGMFGMQTHAYLAMLSSETGTGASMSAASRELLPSVSQITSLDSMVGFWTDSATIRVGLTCALLVGLAFLVVRQTRNVRTERGALLAVAAWCTLGMLATYHRAHDAVLLLLLVPWAVDRVRRVPRQWHAWVVAALSISMSVSASFSDVQRWIADQPEHSVIAFVLLRQSGLAVLLLLVTIQLALRENAYRASERNTPVSVDELTAAA